DAYSFIARMVLPHRAFDTLGLRGPQDTQIDAADCSLGDDVRSEAALSDGEVDGGACHLVGQVLDVKQEVGQLAKRAGAGGRVVAGVGAATCEGRGEPADTLAADLQGPVVAPRLDYQHAVMLGG